MKYHRESEFFQVKYFQYLVFGISGMDYQGQVQFPGNGDLSFENLYLDFRGWQNHSENRVPTSPMANIFTFAKKIEYIFFNFSRVLIGLVWMGPANCIDIWIIGQYFLGFFSEISLNGSATDIMFVIPWEKH